MKLNIIVNMWSSFYRSRKTSSVDLNRTDDGSPADVTGLYCDFSFSLWATSQKTQKSVDLLRDVNRSRRLKYFYWFTHFVVLISFATNWAENLILAAWLEQQTSSEETSRQQRIHDSHHTSVPASSSRASPAIYCHQANVSVSGDGRTWRAAAVQHQASCDLTGPVLYSLSHSYILSREKVELIEDECVRAAKTTRRFLAHSRWIRTSAPRHRLEAVGLWQRYGTFFIAECFLISRPEWPNKTQL